jgi:hypothetical protein
MPLANKAGVTGLATMDREVVLIPQIYGLAVYRRGVHTT